MNKDELLELKERVRLLEDRLSDFIAESEAVYSALKERNKQYKPMFLEWSLNKKRHNYNNCIHNKPIG